jgi:hypothetical protein
MFALASSSNSDDWEILVLFVVARFLSVVSLILHLSLILCAVRSLSNMFFL